MEFFLFYIKTNCGGELAIYFSNPITLSKEQIALIITFTNQIAFAIYRIRNEEQLIRSREEYKTFVENSYEIVLTVDFEGNFLSINEVGIRLSGFDENEIIGFSFNSFVEKSYRDLVNQYLKLLKDGSNKILPFEILVLKKDKSPLWLEINVSNRYERSIAVCIYVMARDITERKLTEAKLIESENKYRELLESAFDLIFTLDINGNFIPANSTAYRYFGYDLNENVSFNIFDILD